MRELRNCDFCGADAAGAFEVVPPSLEPTEAEQRRVVLCPDCRDRLEALIEPLLARAGVEAESRAGQRQRESTGNGGVERTRSVVATANESTEKRRRPSRSNAPVSDPTSAVESEAETDPDTRSGASAKSEREDGITFERTEPTAGNGAETVEGRENETDESSSGDGADSNAEPSGEGVDADESTAAVEQSNRPPGAYSKVIRLLRNRHFPMQRSAVEELVAGAYDLEGQEVEAIVDHAVETGEFVEEREMLDRP
ncbi:hypothetical protein [Natrinema caseinilyticum]|uniref:hypothetical protein n=1 Tax=Natrinema caseinilyticum TaxID=2961570 RepID=UPI0020C4C6F4|nr:hypothetical protein [Natrinema caseinilyticum]